MSISVEGVSDYIWKVSDSSAGMRVPAYVHASEKLMKQIRNDRSLEQLINVSTLPGITGSAVAMPDIHQGYGFPIGGVAAFDGEEGLISPGGVGYDINCGVSLIRSDLNFSDIKSKLTNLVENMFSTVPTGTGKKGLKVTHSQMEDIMTGGLKWAVENNYATEDDILRTELGGSLRVNSTKSISGRALQRGMPQLMTLGAGNHFLEIQKVDKIYRPEVARSFGITSEGQITVMIHTGSRGFGHQVATDFLNILNSGTQDSIISPRDRQLVSAHIKSRTGENYLDSMSAAANFAYVNRQLITHAVRNVFEEVLKMKQEEIKMGLVYGLAHNIARFEEHEVDGTWKKVIVHRKGATRAFPSKLMKDGVFSEFGHPVLIPGDMGSASYVLVGKNENLKLSFGSSCHGAGRSMSRHESLRTYTSSQIKNRLREIGVVAKSASDRVLVEEAPGSYKDVDEVVRSAEGAGLTDVVARMVPVGVIKG